MVVISAYFSGSETGMMTLNRYRLRHRAKQGNRAARRVEKLLRKPDRLISLVLIGNNLVNILASALGTIVGMRLYGNAGVAIATGVLTFVVLVFAEVLPKTIAALYPEKVAYPSSFLLAPLQILMMPLVWLLNMVTRVLMRMAGILNEVFGGNSCIGRMGGDEFAVFLRDIGDRREIEEKIQKLLTEVRAEKERMHLSKEPTASVGIAFVPESGSTFVDVYRAADQALYHVKNSTKNGMAFYDFV